MLVWKLVGIFRALNVLLLSVNRDCAMGSIEHRQHDILLSNRYYFPVVVIFDHLSQF